MWAKHNKQNPLKIDDQPYKKIWKIDKPQKQIWKNFIVKQNKVICCQIKLKESFHLGLFFLWVNPNIPTSIYFNSLQHISTHFNYFNQVQFIT